jgi:ankyrin repeat protein
MANVHSDLFEKLRTSEAKDFLAIKNLDLYAVGDNRQSLVQAAIAQSRWETAAALIERGVPLDQQNKKGETALHYCAFYGAFEIARLLVKRGADLHLIDAFGNEPVWTAALTAKGDYRMVELLVAHGANVTRKNKAGRSVLDFAKQSANKALWMAAGGCDADF